MTRTNKKQWLALAVSSALAAGAHAEIFISQYVEGGGYNKAVEIANSGDSDVTLTDYQLAKSPNSKSVTGSKRKRLCTSPFLLFFCKP